MTHNERASRRYLPILLLLFIGSGCAALIYEVVWFQLLELVIGVSAVSLGVLLGTFMGGMCLGSLLLARVIPVRRHPLRVYAWLEIGIGVIAVLVLVAMPLVGGAYTAFAGTGVAGILFRAFVAAICLLPPTLLMGATLPAMARWIETTPTGVSWLGFFYGGNTGGAVIGSLVAGFYLLRVHDVTTATFAALGLNVGVALIALAIARVARYEPEVTETRGFRLQAEDLPARIRAVEGISDPALRTAQTGSHVSVPGATVVYVAIALSGLTALASEVIWTRLLSLLIGGTVYTFSLILAVFLFGIGIGSSAGSAIARSVARPRMVLGWCQLLLCGAIAWAAYMLAESLPYWPVNPSISTSPWYNFQLDLVRCLWAMLPAAILWGASFPLALASVVTPGQDPGRVVGGVYAANTVGAIVGALATGLLLIAWIGSQHAQQVTIVIAGLAALLLEPFSTSKEGQPARMSLGGTIAHATAVAAVVLLVRSVHPVPGMLVAYGRYMPTRIGTADVIYMGEGWNASVAVTRLSNGVLNYHNAGKVQASSEPQDMRLQRMLGHLTTLLPKNPKSVLVIGCGAGVTAGAVSIEPRLERETIAEIEPLVPEVVSTHFAEQNFDVVRNPKVRIEIDDARHYLLTTKEKFDAITSDPLDPWVKGAAMLYTTEFFEIVKAHLNPGGAVTLFVQLYESNTEAVKSEIATFLEVFPHGVVWGNTNDGRGYDLVLSAQVEPTLIDLDEIEARLRRAEYAGIARSLSEVGIHSAVDLFANYAGQKSDLGPWLKDAAINRDRNLRLQYLAGLGYNLYESDAIYAEMLTYSRFPENLFVGSDALKEQLRGAIARTQGR